MAEFIIPLRNLEEERALFGHLDRNLRLLRLGFEVEAVSRGGNLTLTGDPDRIDRARRRVEEALAMIRNGKSEASDVSALFETDSGPKSGDGGGVRGKFRCPATPKTANQADYLQAIHEHPVTFGIGPAGTGKTFLAAAMAVGLLQSGDYRKLVLVRPAVEAGEHLGFLPGDLAAKINPYLQPLYDALDELLPKGTLKRYLEEGVIEISPLAYMRGRTLNRSVIILDEAQNTTVAQMKMFLTRMGAQSKVIVTGDATQIDLPGDRESGLTHAVKVLRRVEGLAFRHLNREDIVRHSVVQGIVKAYGSWDEREKQAQAEREEARRNSRPPRR